MRVTVAIMFVCLVVAIYFGSWFGIFGVIIGVIVWFTYFFAGWLLDGLQTSMLRLQYHGEEDGRSGKHTLIELMDDRTMFFVVWPVTLLYTMIYIPMILLVRAMFRNKS